VKRGAGLDAGRARVRLIQVRAAKGKVVAERFLSEAVQPGERPFEAAGASFSTLKKKPSPVRAGLTGSDVMMRYLPVPEVEDWRLERLMNFEVQELESHSGAPLATSFNLLPVPKELDEEDTILVGVVREDLLEKARADLGTLPLQGFTPNSVALYNAWLALGDHEPSVTLLANVGASTLDLVLVRGADLYFARSVTSGLEKRDSVLAARLGVDEARAGRLIHRHLDLAAAAAGKLHGDAERVTRPLLSLYEPLATLLGGMVTLCKAQARLRELTLGRVLLCGGGSAARGLETFLASRLDVPVSVWNPVEMVDPAGLSSEEARAFEEDGPGAAVALGLALSAADPDLYALEILSRGARRRRDFRQRGIPLVAAGALALVFLAADFLVTSSRADEAHRLAVSAEATVRQREQAHARALKLKEETAVAGNLAGDLESRLGLQRSAEEMLRFLSRELPGDFWVDGFQAALVPGKEWGFPGRLIPAVTVTGKGKDGVRPASVLFAEFGEKLKSMLPGGEAAIRNTTRAVRGSSGALEWTVEVQLLTRTPPPAEEEEG